MKIILPMILVFSFFVTQHTCAKDPFMYLEDIQGKKALEFAEEHNQKSLGHFKLKPQFQKDYESTLQVLNDKDRITYVSIRKNMAYNFWRDEQNERGLWRRMPVEDFFANRSNWEILLNIDELAEQENENWVYKGVHVEEKHARRALVQLSRGGKDAVVVREFDLEKKEFVRGGFELKEAKSWVNWIDENRITVASDFGEDSLNKSGYPRILKLWRRGQKLQEADTILETSKDDLFIDVDYHYEEDKLTIVQIPVWYKENYFDYNLKTKTLKQYNLPQYLEYKGFYKGQSFYSVREDGFIGGVEFLSGDLIAIDVEKILQDEIRAELVFRPNSQQAVTSLEQTKSQLLLEILEDVKPKILRLQRSNNEWSSTSLMLPVQMAKTSIVWSSRFYDYLLLEVEGFLRPTSLYRYDLKSNESFLLQDLQPKFDASKYEVKQYFATSKDGEKIPYFMVAAKDIPLDGSNPTLINAYGGFMVSRLPYYLASDGKLWLEKGGVFVLANIRGGGEYGPRWHKAAQRHKRQNAFNDLYAVAEDLIAKKISSSAKLAVRGGSNGGLLTGVALTQRPDLFSGVVIAVPLLDMKRYNKLLAGHSWMGEYGNPDIDEDWEFISKYSPYHNIKSSPKYPKALIWTSTKDDRVHPGHARKMTARLEDMGQKVYYYENTEGGHAGAANNKQSATIKALTYNYLYEVLGMPY
tara:strand:+ start:13230 stop:15314 length:2085 start_codon:yes stop_codon:yes gene_type:complete